MGIPESCDFEPKTAAEALLQQEIARILNEPNEYGELKDCPFCANSWDAPQVVQTEQAGRWFVQCLNPQCAGHSGFSDTREEAVACWNKRAGS